MAFSDYEKEILELQISYNSVLDNLKNLVSEEKYEDILQYLHTFRLATDYQVQEIVENDIQGIKQEEDYWFKYIYINQERSLFGDCRGVIFIPLGNNKFFKFYFGE